MNKTNSRKFIASSELFSGYEVYIDLNYCNTLDDIVNSFYDNLYTCLSHYNFEYLTEQVKLCKFHIHSYTFEDIILSDKENVFYVCDHC